MTSLLEKVKKYTNIRPVVVEDMPDAHNVFLVVGGQRFNVTPFACDTKLDAEWVQTQLCVALTKIVDSCCGKP
jgi:hypothetical protein